MRVSIVALSYLLRASLVAYAEEIPLFQIYNLLSAIVLNNKSYDKRIQPQFSHGGPAIVKMNVDVNNIWSVDEKETTVSMTIYFRQRWRDPRLNLNLTTPQPIHSSWMKHFWTPDTFFPDAHSEKLHDVTSSNELVYIGPDGEILYSQRLSLALNCPMDLRLFPMDTQICRILLESFGYTDSQLQFQWHNPAFELSTLTRGEESLPQFVVTSLKTVDVCTSRLSTGNFTCAQGFLTMRRQMGFYVTQFYVPAVLIVCLSFLSFWIDPEAVAARVSLCLLTLLFSATQNSSASANIPKMSYIKAIDIYLTSSMSFIFAVIVEFVLANMQQRAVHAQSSIYQGKSQEPAVVHDIDVQDADKAPSCSGVSNSVNRNGYVAETAFSLSVRLIYMGDILSF